MRDDLRVSERLEDSQILSHLFGRRRIMNVHRDKNDSSSICVEDKIEWSWSELWIGHLAASVVM